MAAMEKNKVTTKLKIIGESVRSQLEIADQIDGWENSYSAQLQKRQKSAIGQKYAPFDYGSLGSRFRLPIWKGCFSMTLRSPKSVHQVIGCLSCAGDAVPGPIV
jgi:hypothetical protein